MSEVRHVLGISGGKDSAALAIYMKGKYPQLPVEYYNTDTGCELAETDLLINRLESYLEGIHRLRAAADSPEPTPFEHFLKASGNFLPSPQQRWCTQKMKLHEMERFVGDAPTISYVGIRGDEDREGYVSTKPNIQAIFPFRKNIWSVDVIHHVLHKKNADRFAGIYLDMAPGALRDEATRILAHPLCKDFYYGRKAGALMDLDVKLFNRAVFRYLKGTDYPVGRLEEFPLVDNDDILVRDDIFRILEDSGVGVPAYYRPIEFEVDGQRGTYNRSRSGCYFCFFQQKIEWIWLYEQHPDLFAKAMEFEKDGYTWNQNESLAELIRPERVRRIKLDAIKRQQALRDKGSGRLADLFGDADDADNDAFCANCFI
ncbi:MAG: phosphoadenosine phosphosulfate reductase [Muribaculaceae bacterium]|nr:phosphoadenosine phosphosulfate reductase [Muribaculaceae bacterium]